MPLSPGTRLGHCDVIALFGEGGMGQAWQANYTQTLSQVVLVQSWFEELTRLIPAA